MKLNSRDFGQGLALVFCVYLIVAVFFTWPLILDIREAVPAGREPEAVAYFQVFSVLWTEKALFDRLPYWDPAFYYPFPGAFSWCEPQLFTCFAVSLFSGAAGLIFSYNTLILVYMALMGLAGFIGAGLLTRDRTAAFFSGMWLCAGAYALEQICAPALLAVWAGFFTIISLIISIKERSVKHLWAAGICFIIAWFTCKQNAFYAAVASFCCLLPCFKDIRIFFSEKKAVSHAAAVILLVFLAIFPYSASQLSAASIMNTGKMAREVKAILFPEQLLTPASGHWLYSGLMGMKGYSWDIGCTVLLLIVSGLAAGYFRSFDKERLYEYKIVSGLVFMAFVMIFFAFGPSTAAYRIVFERIFFLKYLRVPARSVVFAVFSSAVIAGACFAWIRQKTGSRARRRIFTWSVFLILSAEMWTMPIRLVRPLGEISGHEGIVSWLKNNDAGVPVIELPLKRGRDIETSAMIRMTEHGHPVINGYASFTPLSYSQIRKAFASDPAGKGARFIKAYNPGYVILHDHLLDGKEGERLLTALGGKIAYSDSGHRIIKMDPAVPEDMREYLPLESGLKESSFAAGEKYSITLRKTPVSAVLFDLSGGWTVHLAPSDGISVGKGPAIVLTGSFIADKGEDKLYFRVIKPFGKNTAARAVLYSPELRK